MVVAPSAQITNLMQAVAVMEEMLRSAAAAEAADAVLGLREVRLYHQAMAVTAQALVVVAAADLTVPFRQPRERSEGMGAMLPSAEAAAAAAQATPSLTVRVGAAALHPLVVGAVERPQGLPQMELQEEEALEGAMAAVSVSAATGVLLMEALSLLLQVVA